MYPRYFDFPGVHPGEKLAGVIGGYTRYLAKIYKMRRPRTSLGYTSVLGIRIRMFLGLLDKDPDPSIIKQK
jgi:hypothetical protein